MAITTLPLSKWYYESTSPWTLDYPPFFAYFELILSKVMGLIDSSALVLTAEEFSTDTLTLFQRSSVIISEIVFYYGMYRLSKSLHESQAEKISIFILANPGILLVDHIHFQYNAMLYGIQLLSIAAVYEGKHILAGVYFAIVLNFKHIYLYQALAYFVYLLGGYCFHNKKLDFSRFIKLGSAVITVFAISFGPFYKHIPQILSRLFPFGRGLTHAYWAPNFWALYSFADRGLVKILRIPTPSMTRGLVGDVNFGFLPTPTASTTAILTLVFQLPILYRLWHIPSPTMFVNALSVTAFTSFMFGYHVHEKAILMVLIPLALTTTTNDLRFTRCFAIASVSGLFALFPLVYKPTEHVTKVILLLMYMIYISQSVTFTNKERLYISGFVLLHIYMTLHPLFFDTYEFLPLMLCSVYTAIGTALSYSRLYILSLTQ